VRVPADSFALALVTPYAWESRHEVNRAVEATGERLAGRGHAVVLVAPSQSPERVREGRAAIRAGHAVPAPGAAPRLLAVGEAIAGGAGTAARRRAALPIDVARTVEQLFVEAALDVCHVHEPFAPSVASTALRHSRALNVGTFHAPTERLVSTQVARRLVDLVLGRLDARVASFAATATLMDRHFPADYRVVLPGADAAGPPAREGGGGGDGTVRIAFVDDEERGALRLFLRALRRLRADVPWRATVVTDRGASSSIPLREDLRARVTFAEDGEAEALRAADVCVLGSDGAEPAPGLALRAIAAGAVPLASSLAVYEEVLGEGDHGLLFDPGDPDACAGQLGRLVGDGDLRARLRSGAQPLRETLTWDRMTDELEAVYASVAARRHPVGGDAGVRRRLAGRRLIDVDLHMHTDHSPDCATPVEVLLATARDQGFGAIAVTDHNVVSGALEAQAKAERYGVKVIVAEEVKTASQGEVIGLFLDEVIPRGLTLAETVAEIRRQGGLVYVPHPFDRMHAVPDYEHLLTIVEEIDAIEIYNPRVAIGSFNEEAERFAAKYRIVAGAGSDAHVAPGLGSVRIRMPDFDGPGEFMEALRAAEIRTKPSSLLYVQALKFLETKATPSGARAARRARRVRRATRKA
jgi:glycosyltransferase involved in cell wall biosynthesis